MKTLEINCSKNYNIMIGAGLLPKAGALIAQRIDPCRVCIVTDETVGGLYGGPNSPLWQGLQNAGFEVYEFTFPAGERNKRLSTVESILSLLADHNFDRKDALIALGGGVPGDITGFAAAIYMRGIRFIQIPTTLLACVDSSIGGKTGVDLEEGKNLAGAFWQPELVIEDIDVFDTLTDDLYRDGYAEIVKAGMIGDSSIVQSFRENDIRQANKAALTEIIVKALNVKSDIVAQDEREAGLRQLLNLGHTIGHAIEKCSDYSISHGSAVATGCVIASAAAASKGWTDLSNAQLIKDIFIRHGFDLDPCADAKALAAAAGNDKKSHGDSVTIIYPVSPGNCDMRPLLKSELESFIRSGLDIIQ
jgi:3-dehydroquinate synthase